LREYRNDKFEKGSVVLIDKDNIGKNDANSFVMGMINKYKGFGVYQVSIIPDDRTTQYFDMDNTDISEFMLSGNNVVDLDESLITPMDFADKELNCVIRYPSDMPRVSKADIEFLQELTKNDSLTQSELNRLVALKEKLEYFDTSRDV
jgi:hypothetical protein